MSLTKSKIFLIFCIAFIVGVFLGRFINYQIMAVLAMIFIIVGTIGFSNRTVLIFAIAAVFALAGSWRFMTDYRQNDLQVYYGQKLSFTGIVSMEPDARSDKTYLTMNHVTIQGHQLQSKLLLSMGRFPEYKYGQLLNLEGKIEEPAEFEDFSYKNYLSRFGIDAVVYHPKIFHIEDGRGNVVKDGILKFKNKFSESLAFSLPEPQNAFLSGLLLGAKRSIPQDLLDKFNLTGTSHIVAISGFNITIIAYGLDLALRHFRKRVSFGISLLAIAAFVIATGASASVIRAGIMGALLLIALNIGRVYAITNALAFTAAVMLAINPQVLMFDIGFQLSFLSLMGLVYFTPILDQFYLPVPKLLKTALFATLAAQIFTLPILLISFGQISVVAPIVNILVLGVVPLTMLSGFLAGMLSLIFPILALPFVWVSWLLLTYIIRVVEIFAAIPFAAVQWQANWWFGVVYYLVLTLVMMFYYYPQLKLQIFNLILWKPKPKVSLSI